MNVDPNRTCRSSGTWKRDPEPCMSRLVLNCPGFRYRGPRHIQPGPGRDFVTLFTPG